MATSRKELDTDDKRNNGRIRGTNSGSAVEKVDQAAMILTRMIRMQFSRTHLKKGLTRATIGHSMRKIGNKTSGIKTVLKTKAIAKTTKISRIHHIMAKVRTSTSKTSKIGGNRKGLNTSNSQSIHSMKAMNSSMVKNCKELTLVMADPEVTHTISSSSSMDDPGNNIMETMTGTTSPSKISSLSTGSSSSSQTMISHKPVKMFRKTCPISILPLSTTLQATNTKIRARHNLWKIKVSRIHLSSTSLQSQMHLYLQHQSMIHYPLTKVCLKLSHSPTIRHKSLLSRRTLSKTTMWHRTATHSCLNNHMIPRLHHMKETPISRLLLHSMVTPKPTTTMMLKTCSSKYHNKLNSRRVHNLSLLLMCPIRLALTKTSEKKNNFISFLTVVD